MTGVRTDAVAEIANDLNLTKTRIRKDFTIYKASVANLSGKIVSSGKPVGLASFIGTRQTMTGVSVKVKTQGQRTILKHAFLANAKGAQNVFWRKYNGQRKPIKPGFAYGKMPKMYRMPVERLSGPRIQDIFAKKEVLRVVEVKATKRLDNNLAHEIDYELQKNG